MVRFRFHAAVGAFVTLGLFAFASGASPADTRLLDCAVFPADLTAERLRARFGRTSVVDGPVEVGEGASEPGTIVFPDSADSKVEVVWWDAANRSRPQLVTVRAKTSRWHTREGLRLGLNLRQVERINRRPFRISGFDWDYGGTATSWSGGALGRAYGQGCRMTARFSPANDSERPPIGRQVIGDKLFSSGHPAMQALNPVIYELFLQYEQ
jgi:hypothetical protein